MVELRALGVLFLIALCMSGCARLKVPGPMMLYVSPRGSDAATGRSAGEAFATLARARDEIRKLKASGELPRGATVNVLSGTHCLAEPLALGPEDSGTADAPIVYRGTGAEKPRLVGATPLAGFKPFREKILQCDLNANGLAGRRFGQLFSKGRRMVLARYPNADPADIHGGQWAHVAMVEGTENHREFFYDSDEKHTWAHPEEGRVHLFGGYDWAFNVTPIAKHVPDERRIVLKGNSWGPLRIGDRYIIDGLFEELDAPGEWYLDPRTDTLYFWPPEDTHLSPGERSPAKGGRVRVPSPAPPADKAPAPEA